MRRTVHWLAGDPEKDRARVAGSKPAPSRQQTREKEVVMAGFEKSAVVKALESRLKEAREVNADFHTTRFKAWESERADIQRAKKNLRQAVRDLTDGRIEIEAFAQRIKSSGRGYRTSWVDYSAKKVPAAPRLEKSEREVTLERLIDVAKSATGEAFSVNEMKALGILGWVKA